MSLIINQLFPSHMLPSKRNILKPNKKKTQPDGVGAGMATEYLRILYDGISQESLRNSPASISLNTYIHLHVYVFVYHYIAICCVLLLLLLFLLWFSSTIRAFQCSPSIGWGNWGQRNRKQLASIDIYRTRSIEFELKFIENLQFNVNSAAGCHFNVVFSLFLYFVKNRLYSLLLNNNLLNKHVLSQCAFFHKKQKI